MNLGQWKRLRELPENIPTVTAAEIGGPDRTILLGYTYDRMTWHAYLMDGQVHLVVYDALTDEVISHSARSSWDASELVPGKRVYPESTDERFAHLLHRRGVVVPFRSFDETRAQRFAHRAFHGMTLDLTDHIPEHREDPALNVATSPVGPARYDLVIRTDTTDNSTKVFLFHNGVPVPEGLNIHHVRPHPGRDNHAWLAAMTTRTADAPRAVAALVADSTRKLHRLCRPSCGTD